MRSLTKAWLSAAGFLLAGIGLIWWANQQLAEIRLMAARDFSFPTGRVALWLLTLVVTGVAFGLTVTMARRDSGRGRVPILAVLTLIPLAELVLFVASIAGPLPFSVPQFLISESTVVISALLLGFLVSGMIGLRKAQDPET